MSIMHIFLKNLKCITVVLLVLIIISKVIKIAMYNSCHMSHIRPYLMIKCIAKFFATGKRIQPCKAFNARLLCHARHLCPKFMPGICLLIATTQEITSILSALIQSSSHLRAFSVKVFIFNQMNKVRVHCCISSRRNFKLIFESLRNKSLLTVHLRYRSLVIPSRSFLLARLLLRILNKKPSFFNDRRTLAQIKHAVDELQSSN